MGCCYSSENEASSEGEESKPLLQPATSPPNKSLNGTESNCYSLPSARTDEQALLSSILAKTAINIIDVSAADSQGMEQHEYMDRARQYSCCLCPYSSTPGNVSWSNSLMHWKKLPRLPGLLTNQSALQVLLPANSRAPSRTWVAAAYAFSALSQIRVDAKEELVVQFGIP
uniref:Ragulator complex protein lamtor1 n=1 Tax=Sphaerodactylus townsendi TaxID=933632 RepID=A0ACB8FFK0_9SAUR